MSFELIVGIYPLIPAYFAQPVCSLFNLQRLLRPSVGCPYSPLRGVRCRFVCSALEIASVNFPAPRAGFIRQDRSSQSPPSECCIPSVFLIPMKRPHALRPIARPIRIPFKIPCPRTTPYTHTPETRPRTMSSNGIHLDGSPFFLQVLPGRL